MKIDYYNPNPGTDEDSFLGLFEGRKTRAKSAAAVAIEQAKQDTLALEALVATKGYTPKADASKAAIDLANAEGSSDKTLYIILAVVVVAVMVGLYFIVKNRK